MCGRYASFMQNNDVADLFEIAAQDIDPDLASWAPSWNISPTQSIRIVAERSGEPAEVPPDGAAAGAPRRVLHAARWGLVPAWAKDPRGTPPLFNARSETVADKPSFRQAYQRRRCLIPADAYYEWQRRAAGVKQAWAISQADGTPFAFAGLYEFWRPRPGAPWLVSATILTAAAGTVSCDDRSAIHDRYPVSVAPDDWDRWLSRSNPGQAVTTILEAPARPCLLTAIGAAVNTAGNDGPDLLDPLPDQPPIRAVGGAGAGDGT